MRFMQIESVLQTKNRSEPAKNRFSVALRPTPENASFGTVTISASGLISLNSNQQE